MTIDKDLHEKIIETHAVVTRLEPVIKDHEIRIRKSERFRYTVFGWAAAVGGGVAGLAETIKHTISGSGH